MTTTIDDIGTSICVEIPSVSVEEIKKFFGDDNVKESGTSVHPTLFVKPDGDSSNVKYLIFTNPRSLILLGCSTMEDLEIENIRVLRAFDEIRMNVGGKFGKLSIS